MGGNSSASPRGRPVTEARRDVRRFPEWVEEEELGWAVVVVVEEGWEEEEVGRWVAETSAHVFLGVVEEGEGWEGEGWEDVGEGWEDVGEDRDVDVGEDGDGDGGVEVVEVVEVVGRGEEVVEVVVFVGCVVGCVGCVVGCVEEDEAEAEAEAAAGAAAEGVVSGGGRREVEEALGGWRGGREETQYASSS